MKVKVYSDNSWKFSVEAIFQEQKSNNLDRGFDNEYIENKTRVKRLFKANIEKVSAAGESAKLRE